jgi:hypothetical protein
LLRTRDLGEEESRTKLGWQPLLSIVPGDQDPLVTGTCTGPQIPNLWHAQTQTHTHGAHTSVCMNRHMQHPPEHSGVTALPAQVVGQRHQEATEDGEEDRDVLLWPRSLGKELMLVRRSKGKLGGRGAPM